MIVKIQETFHDTTTQPIMLILTAEEKAAITALKPDQFMVAFYPKDKGYSEALLTQWMNQGIQFVNPEVTNGGQNNVQG